MFTTSVTTHLKRRNVGRKTIKRTTVLDISICLNILRVNVCRPNNNHQIAKEVRTRKEGRRKWGERE
jgi:hypothetical protein